MKRIVLFLAALSVFVFYGCGSSSSDNVNVVLQPTYQLSDINMSKTDTLNDVKVKITLKETNSEVFNVNFANLLLKDDTCNIVDQNITYEGNNVYSVEFKTDSSCTDISGLYLNGTESADYMDTTVKNITKDFSLNIGKDLQTTFSNIDSGLTVSKIILTPSTINVIPGLKQDIQILTLDKDNNPVSATVTINRPVDENDNLYGEFDKYTVTTDQTGEATVEYTAPSSLTGLNSEYNVSFSSDGLVKYLELKLQTTNSATETNATSYEITLSLPESFQVDSSGSFSVNIVDKYDQTNSIDSQNVYDVKIVAKNSLLYFDENKTQTSYEYNSSASKVLNIYTGIYSGIEELEISAKIFDGENNVTLTQTVPVTIESGPISAISINYTGSSYDSETGLFEDTYSVHAVDKYSNPAKEGSKIVVGAVIGEKVVGANGNIYEGTDGGEFKDLDGVLYSNIEPQDTLIVFANANSTDGSYLGGWIVSDKSDDNKTLYLSSEYNGSDVAGLKYVVGNEKRYNMCEDGLAVADFDHVDKTYEIGSDGTTTLKLRYDRYLVGKTISLYVNSYQNERIGAATKRILWGTGVTSTSEVCDATYGETTCDLGLRLSLDTGSDSNFYLENTLTGGFQIVCENGGYKINSEDDLTDCNGKIDINITVDAGAKCTIDWDGSVVYEY